MKEYYGVGLYIYSDSLSPERISSIVGLDPERSFSKGERKSVSEDIVFKTNGWILRRQCDTQYEMMDLLSEFLLTLEPHKEGIRLLSDQGHTVQISLGITSSDGRPILYFDKKIVRTLGELGVDFDIDEYIFPEEKSP